MKYLLPHLPYPTSALEPYIDSYTMQLHHDKHHGSYVDALNEIMQSAPVALQEKNADWLLTNLDEIPENIRKDVCHNAGGHVNHSMLWRVMSPSGSDSIPSPQLSDAIHNAFGSIDKLKSNFNEAGTKHFGSGWVWLVKSRNANENLKIITTSGHDNPLSLGYVPILVNDVWEHAYYLKYKNQRSNYLNSWWAIVNWDEVSQRFDHPADPAEHHEEKIASGNLEVFG